MYNLWVTEVYNKIDDQVKKYMASMESGVLNRRLNTMFDLYLDAARGKTIYLDVIIESEYDPMEAKSEGLTMDMRGRSVFIPWGEEGSLGGA